RFACALAFSIFVHALVLLLQFGGGGGFGLPGLAWPWTERRVLVTDLTVRIEEAPRPPPVKLRLSDALEAVPPIAQLSVPPPKVERKVRPKPQPQILAQKAPQPETFNVPPPKRAEAPPQPAPQPAEKKE